MANSNEIIQLDIGDNLIKLTEKLANQIGVAADKIFPWFIKHEIIGAYCGIFTPIFIFILGLIMLKLNFEKGRFNDEEFNFNSALSIVALILIVAGFIAMLWLPYNISTLINPEYFALENFMEKLSKLK